MPIPALPKLCKRSASTERGYNGRAQNEQQHQEEAEHMAMLLPALNAPRDVGDRLVKAGAAAIHFIQRFSPFGSGKSRNLRRVRRGVSRVASTTNASMPRTSSSSFIAQYRPRRS